MSFCTRSRSKIYTTGACRYFSLGEHTTATRTALVQMTQTTASRFHRNQRNTIKSTQTVIDSSARSVDTRLSDTHPRFVSHLRMTRNWVLAHWTARYPTQFLPKRDYVMFGSLLSQIRLSVVCNVCGGSFVGFRQYFSPFCILAVLWSLCKIVRRLSHGNPSVGGVKRKMDSKIERCYVRVSHLLMSFLSNRGQWLPTINICK